jgi:hypothetical protein
MVLLVGKCSHGVYTSVSEGFENFPGYAKKEVMYKKYNNLLSSIDEAVKQSDSYLSLAAKLEKIKKPDELIYFFLKSKNESRALVKKFKGSRSSKVLINGTGYGQVDGQHIVIIDYPVNQYGVKSCLMYFLDRQKGNKTSKNASK